MTITRPGATTMRTATGSTVLRRPRRAVTGRLASGPFAAGAASLGCAVQDVGQLERPSS